MIAALKAELRKIITVRSTYFILLICLALEIVFAFYATAYRAHPAYAKNPMALANEVTDAINVLSMLMSLVGLLLVTHEYRYNTIVYSLSASRNRSYVFAAKIIAISCFMILFSTIFSLLSPLLAELGWHARGIALAPQHFDFWNLWWRAVFAGWAFGMLGLIIAFLVRIQVGAIATFFLFPGTIEQLIGLILKQNQVYLPFTATHAILSKQPNLTNGHAALVSLAYIIAGFIISWILFMRRDAS